ncbi:MAG: hypothetical protein LQ351_000148 [Letrouitia transgressa]|nr:MAG: hypothetical protein LQ351_000148 [Letrouitia transgressa]
MLPLFPALWFVFHLPALSTGTPANLAVTSGLSRPITKVTIPATNITGRQTESLCPEWPGDRSIVAFRNPLPSTYRTIDDRSLDTVMNQSVIQALALPLTDSPKAYFSVGPEGDDLLRLEIFQVTRGMKRSIGTLTNRFIRCTVAITPFAYAYAMESLEDNREIAIQVGYSNLPTQPQNVMWILMVTITKPLEASDAEFQRVFTPPVS